MNNLKIKALLREQIGPDAQNNIFNGNILDKVICPGMKYFEYANGYRRSHPVFCKIEIDNEGELHITGVEGPNMHGNCAGGCGQIYPIHIYKFAPGWNQSMLNKFNAIWKKWHLHRFFNGRNEGLPRDLPEDVVEFLKSLPDTYREPNWV
jgi:hypothetical protein